MLAWMAVVSLLAVRLIRNNLLFSRRLREARLLDPAKLPIDWSHLQKLAGIRRAIPLMETEQLSAPAVWGLLRPRVLVPPGLVERLPTRPLAWVLLHELTHIRRHDLWLNLFQRFVQVTYFFHPAAWIAGRMIHVHCEYACDDAALAACRETTRQECGRGLLAVVEQAQKLEAKATIKLGLGLLGTKHFLRQRVVRILDTRRVLHNRISLGAAVLLVGLALLTLPYVRAQIGTLDQPARQSQPSVAAGPQSQASTTDALLVPKYALTQASATDTALIRNDDGTRRSMEILVINAKTQQPEPGVTIRYGTSNPQEQGVTDKDGRAKAQTFRTIDVPGSIPGNTLALGINDHGRITGYFKDKSGWHGFIRQQNAVFSTFDAPGAAGNTFAFGISNKGEIVGRARLANGEDVGFLRKPNGEVNTFSVPGARVTQAYGINEQSQVVGTYSDGIRFHGFLRSPSGQVDSIDVPGATYTTARGINNRGQIVGHYQTNDGWHGFRRDPDGTITTIDVILPGGTPFETRLTGIDSLGRVAGYTTKQNVPGNVGLVTDRQGSVTALRVPSSTGPEGSQAYGINEKGQIVGYFTDSTGSHGFLVNGE